MLILRVSLHHFRLTIALLLKYISVLYYFSYSIDIYKGILMIMNVHLNVVSFSYMDISDLWTRNNYFVKKMIILEIHQ